MGEGGAKKKETEIIWHNLDKVINFSEPSRDHKKGAGSRYSVLERVWRVGAGPKGHDGGNG